MGNRLFRRSFKLQGPPLGQRTRLGVLGFLEPVALGPVNHHCLRCIRVGPLPIVAETLQRNRLGFRGGALQKGR